MSASGKLSSVYNPSFLLPSRLLWPLLSLLFAAATAAATAAAVCEPISLEIQYRIMRGRHGTRSQWADPSHARVSLVCTGCVLVRGYTHGALIGGYGVSIFDLRSCRLGSVFLSFIFLLLVSFVLFFFSFLFSSCKMK